jgi:PAS domain S-box-containing protein
MPRLSPRMVSRLRKLDTFAFRIGLIVGICMLVSVTIAAAISYRNTLAIVEQKENLAVNVQLDLISAQVAQAIGTAALIGSTLAKDEAITSALLDDSGLGRFLQPVLTVAKTSLSRIVPDGSQVVGVEVMLLDFMGHEVAPWKGTSSASFAGEPWVRQVMNGQIQGIYQKTTDELLVAYPVLFPGTGQPEGSLVLRFSVRGVSSVSGASRWRVVIGPDSRATELHLDPALRVTSRKLNLPQPFENLDWEVALAYPIENLERQARSILWSFLIAVLIGIPLIIGAAVMIGRQLARPVTALAVDAMRISDPSAPESEFESTATGRGTFEIRALIKALHDSRRRVIESTAAMRLSQEGLNAAQEGVVIADASVPGAPVVYVNSAFETISGYSRDELIGRPCRIISAADSQDKNVTELHQALSNGERCEATVLTLGKDGRPFWDEIRVAPLRTSEGELSHLIILHKDVSDRKSEQENLQELQKLEAIGQLTGGLAHDFNNLLGIVVGNLDLLHERLGDDPASLKQHRAALDAALRAAEVAHSLLAVARRQPLDVSVHDLSELIDEILPLLRSSAGSAVRIQTHLAQGGLLARLDVAGMSNVVLNLVINARDAMAKVDRDRVLILRTYRAHFEPSNSEQLEPGDYVALEVGDNGLGMDEQTASHAFEPFFTTKERGKGTGLGLAMVFGFAQQLGGTAKIDSVQGKGTVVSVYLPAQPGDAMTDKHDAQIEEFRQYNDNIEEAQQDAVVVSAPGERSEPLQARDSSGINDPMSENHFSQSGQDSRSDQDIDVKGRVLVVDDEEGLCELACLWIESLGYEVQGVHSPAEALELLKTGDFDFLFTDVVMPGGMDGIQLAREALKMNPDIHVLLASGYAKALLDEQSPPGPLLNKPYRKPDLARAFDAVASGESSVE